MNKSTLTADQTATMFSVKPASVRRWATRTAEHPPCPHTKDGRGRLRFDPDAVAEWLDRTGVGRRSRAQTRVYPPPPPVAIYSVIKWAAENISANTHDAADLELVALSRTIKSCLHVCRHAHQLPDPPDLDLDNADDREAGLVFLMALDRRPAAEWKYIAHNAIEQAGEDALLKAIHA